MKKKIVVFLVACSLFAAIPQIASATDFSELPGESVQNEITPRYRAILKINPSISRIGSIKCDVQTIGNDYSLTVDLQQYIDGSWEDIDSWTENGSSGGTFSTTASLERGQKYRVRAYLRVYDDNGSLIETATKYSATV